MKSFCTIVTADFFPYCTALLRSLKKFDDRAELYVLVVDVEGLSRVNVPEGIHLVFLHDLKEFELVGQLYDKYAHINYDHFRWSLKPVFIAYVLQHYCEKVLYVDSDIYFFNDYSFLFDELDHHSVLLTPHWYTPWPLKNQEAFIQLLTTGIFNAGFIGCRREGLPAMRWWAEACHFRMGHSNEFLVHDDQKYLDLVPILFENTKIIKHKGCNLMSGNYEERPRKFSNGKVLIGGGDPVIFIHFNRPLIQHILMGFDPLLVPFLDAYKKELRNSGVPETQILRGVAPYVNPSVVRKIKWRLHLRTRVKAFLYSLAKRL